MSSSHFRTVVAGDFAAKGLTAAFVIALVRSLPPTQLADYVYVSALVVLGATLFSGFFNRHYIVSNASPGISRLYRRWQVTSSALAFVAAAALLAWDRDLVAMAAALWCTAAAAAFDFARTHAQRLGQFHRYAGAEVLRTALSFTIALPILWLLPEHTVAALLAGQAIAYAAATRLLPTLPPFAGPRPDLQSLLANRMASYLVAYFALLGILAQLPTLVLQRTGSAFDLATFGSAMRYYGLTLGIVVAANVVLLPRLSAARDTEQLLTLLRDSRTLVVGALLLLAAAALAGYLVIPWVDGGAYPDAPLLFLILSAALVPGVMMAPVVNAYLRLNWLGVLVRSLSLAVFVSAAVALGGPTLDPVHPARWAAAAVGAGTATMLCALTVDLVRHRGRFGS
jgi:O-antigen/teichoic acid export membrane protein